jgi:hypothetical protein
MDWSALFYELLHAEEEAEALGIIERYKLDAASNWLPLGGVENNFSIVSNQQADPTGAFVEKIINAIDANLMAQCFAKGIGPETDAAPSTMVEAVEKFFGVRNGMLGELLNRQRTDLADAIQIVAVGSRENPCYLVIDRGEGQTPMMFPETFLSLAKSNKMRIPFVQGKFNAGGTGVLQFCGSENIQLIASRRHPSAPTDTSDKTRDAWGFTLVRRLEPSDADKRRSSMYVYLAPGGQVPMFRAQSLKVIPGVGRKEAPAEAYSLPLDYGTVVKLYNYRWKARSLATTEARFELEKYLHSPCLPFRITETRDYRANFYSTTVSGVWATINASENDEDSKRVEDGFPAPATLNLESIGPLNYRIAVFKPEVDSRRVPHGVFFAVNGQVHGSLPPDFVARRLEFEYLRGSLLVSIDCTHMKNKVREDFFMASRDRLRRNEVYEEIVSNLEADLKAHPGLRAINGARRAKALEKALSNQEDMVNTLNELLRVDPTLRSLFQLGDRLITKAGPGEVDKFTGVRFPTFFNPLGAHKGTVEKQCAVNRSCRVDFETDAENEYFERGDSPGTLTVTPMSAYKDYRPWNGIFSLRFRPPATAKPGDVVQVAISVTDPDRDARGKSPFTAQLSICVGKPDHSKHQPGPHPPKPEGDSKEAAKLAMPNILEIREDQWNEYKPAFTAHDSLRLVSDGSSGYDYILNLDNAYLLTQSKQLKDLDKSLIVYWFKWGLALCAMGMVRHLKKAEAESTEAGSLDLINTINQALNGLASVIVPVIRNLYRGPVKG